MTVKYARESVLNPLRLLLTDVGAVPQLSERLSAIVRFYAFVTFYPLLLVIALIPDPRIF